ncbi:MAG: Fur family transcriptional regulator [Syntrophotaleaceae bacterium]
MVEKRERFRQYMISKGLKSTRQREVILDAFLNSTDHISTEDLYLRIRSKHPHIGYATVYRTLKLFAESGIAQERDFGAGQTLYETSRKGEHHDHLICTQCGEILEFEDSRIERLQEQVAKERDFVMTHHRLEIFGLCSKCGKK